MPRDPQALAPGGQCHLPVSAALQASRDALLGAARFLKRRQLSKLLETQQTEMVGACLVRMALQAHTQPGEAPLPQFSVHGASSCAPALCAGTALPAPHTGSFSPWSPRVLMEPQPSWDLPAGWHRREHQASGSLQAPVPPARCMLVITGVWAGEGRRGQSWASGENFLQPCPLVLSPAHGRQQQSGGLPAPEPAVPAEPTGALA